MSANVKCACGNCGQNIEFPADLQGTQAACPHCGETTLLQASPLKSSHAPSLPAPKKLSPEEQLRERINGLVIRANIFSGASQWCCALAALCLLITILVSVNSMESASDFALGLSIMAGLISTAIFLYMVSQIIHIRANTEK